MSAISLKNLDIAYGDTPVVEGVTLDIAEGECFGLVGESGSGKSTVLRAITGLAPDWTGEISLMGKPRGKAMDKSFAALCQMVFQDPYGSLHPRQTVDATLSEPLAIHGIEGADRRVPEMMDACGLAQHFRFRLPHQLSGGQRQRVAIARALAADPEIILADEPTASLDRKTADALIADLVTLARDEGKTLIAVSHDPAVHDRMDTVIEIVDGRIVSGGVVDG